MKITEKFLKDELDQSELIEAWHIYCIENCYYELCFYNMSMIDEALKDKTPSEILCMIHDTKFDIEDDYFKINEYELESTSKPIEWIDLEELALYINDNDYEFKYLSELWNRLTEEDLRLIALREGTYMNADVMVFETNAPKEELQALECKCQLLLKEGKDVDELPTWSTELELKGYVFDFVDDYPNYLRFAEVENIEEQYCLEGE